MRILHIVITVLLLAHTSQAQTVLGFEEALAKVLENNHDIRLSKLTVEMAENSASRAANGYVPQVSGSGGYNWTYYEGTNQLQTEDIHYDPNNSYTYNAGLTVSYSIFDGFGRKYRFEQAEGNKVLSDIELRSIMESTIVELSQTYYEVARLQQQVASLDSTLTISQQRLKRSEYGLEFGQSKMLDLLNARVDLNTDSINLLNSLQQEANMRRNLNLLMGEAITTIYKVNEEVVLMTPYADEEVLNTALEKGSRISLAQQQKQNADLAIGMSRAAWYPQLGLSGSYQYRGSDDPNGAFLIGSSSYGPTAGLSLSWTLFDATNKTQVQNAKLQFESTAVSLEQTELQVRTDALNANGAYRNALFVLEASRTNVATAEDNFARSETSFRTGQIGSVEYRLAQSNLLNARLQLSGATYDAKQLELQLLALMGELVE